MKIIAFAGKKFTGKTKCAEILADILGPTVGLTAPYVPILAFADPIKRICCQLFNLTREQVFGDLKDILDPRYGKTPRQLILEVGGAIRAIDPDAWVRATMGEIGFFCKDDPFVLIQGVRYPNEAAAVKARGGKVYLVTRDTGEVDPHESENALHGYAFDGMIDNNRNIESLTTILKGIAKEVQA